MTGMSGEDGGHGDIEDRADDEGSDDADREVACGFLASSAVVDTASNPM